MFHLVWLAYANYRDQKNQADTRRNNATRSAFHLVAGPGRAPTCSIRASSASVPCRLAAAMFGLTKRAPRPDRGARLMRSRARPIIVWRRTVAPAFGQSTRALSERK